MSTFGKILVFLNLILAVLYAGVSAVLYTQRVDFKTEIQKLENERTAFIAFMDSKGYLSSSESQKVQEGGEILNYTTVVQKLNSEIQTLKSSQEIAISKLQSDVDQKAEKITTLNNALKDEVSKRKSLEQAARDAEIDRKKLLGMNENLTNRLDELAQGKASAEEQLKIKSTEHDALYVKFLERTSRIARLQEELKSSEVDNKSLNARMDESLKEIKAWRESFPNDVERIVSRGKGGSGKVIRGRVLGVKPDLNLVIIDRGNPDGVRPGTQFIVYRGNEYVGRIEVDKVIGEFSSARVLISKLDIQQGDRVANHLGK